jgi:hypothetical protein
MLVAIVDSGITLGHPHLGDAPVEAVTLEDGAGVWAPGGPDRTGHGTAAAAAILRLAPGVGLLSLRILDDELRTTRHHLDRAIREAARRGARVVYLSLGSTAPEAEALLADAVREAEEHGAICVAPAHPRGLPLWPGDLPTVLSAEADEQLLLQDLVAVPGDRPRFRLHAWPRPIPGRSPTDNFRGPSFAAASLSGRVAALLLADPHLDRAGVVTRLSLGGAP